MTVDTPNTSPAPYSESSSNSLHKLGHALKPSTLVSKLHHSKDTDTSQSHEQNQLEQGKAAQRTEERRREKEEKARRAEEEKEEVARRRKESDEVASKTEDQSMRERYGDLEIPGEIIPLDDVVQLPEGRSVTFRARIHTQRELSTQLDFIIFRHRGYTIQGVLSGEIASEHMIKWTERIPSESIVQVSGKLAKPPKPIKLSVDSPLEVRLESIHLVEPSKNIPFGLYHGEPPPQRSRLGNRTLDLRHPTNQAIFKIRARLLRVFRETLDDMDFIEINTPKLQPAATESGAEVFRVNYFGRKAFLAQSPQLMKQMAISADFGRVYEIGPVFRAENSNTHRHLTEYTGLDIELSLKQDYHEVFYVLDQIMKNMFRALATMKSELGRVREVWNSEEFVFLDETPIIPFSEAIQMLRDDGRDVEEEDLHTPDEIRLGKLVKQKYHTDYYIIDRFPKSARPFYTANDGKTTNSFDMFIRGQEICTGGQRINDPFELRESMRESGINEDEMEEYLSAFDWGMPPHGGAGLGLERIITFYLDLPDIRLSSLFHRDPHSLPTKKPSLPHPEADTTKPRDLKADLPPLEDLIANYGDATNTSWLDDRFTIWRDQSTGAAVGYVEQDKFCMITGDPLCSDSQKSEITKRFLVFVEDELKLKPIWMLVSSEFQETLAEKYGWRSLSCTQEQRSNSDKVKPEVIQNSKQQRGVFSVREVNIEEEQDTKNKIDERIKEWQEHRSSGNKKGKQIHLTEIAPWRDSGHRRYFIAESDPRKRNIDHTKKTNGDKSNDKDEPRIETLVVLTRLSPKHGYQLKWALDFPSSPKGAIESTVQSALSAVPGEPVTFGASVSESFLTAHGIGEMRSKIMERTYKGIVKSLSLDKKAEFREKFGVEGERTFICYPKGGIRVTELNEIVKFFEE
ncbi:aspartate-tRNA(Asn) ligase [Kwoniella mangroviensis CBS 10435]|uniref:Probable aspartate--tRNA ligase, cytoplasmic n=1 Tax=Kwoniella mangroviensis CBS 10435 TaxID=1331196 RepID=A0A1B9IQH3_9TREE|nr:aspartate-tRNA(Asn) ligase [Kwoniella mangroviensis CBS 10435]